MTANLADREGASDWIHKSREYADHDAAGPDVAAEIAYWAGHRYDASTGQWS